MKSKDGQFVCNLKVNTLICQTIDSNAQHTHAYIGRLETESTYRYIKINLPDIQTIPATTEFWTQGDKVQGIVDNDETCPEIGKNIIHHCPAKSKETIRSCNYSAADQTRGRWNIAILSKSF
jgi:hypothetical protein